MLPVQVGRFCLLIFCAIIVSLVHFTIAQYSHINHPLFVNQDLYSAASSGWDVAWDSAWDPWSSGWSYPNTLSYDHKYKPKHAIFEAAEVLLIGKKKNETIRGVIQIYQFMDEYIDIKGIICNLKPHTLHGLHVHKFGEIHPNCSSTLGHFNPYGQKHGPHKNDRIHDRHLGDLGNIKANASGIATFRIKDYNLRIDDNRFFSILGRSLVLHSRKDDLGNDKINVKGSEHNGNSGIPVACGVVGLAQATHFNSKPLRC